MSYIPEKFMQAIVNFLCAEKTGKIILNVKEGQILKLELDETFSL